jgi:hypothetical protein
MALPNEFFREPRNDAFSAAVEFRRDRLRKWSDLSDPHVFFPRCAVGRRQGVPWSVDLRSPGRCQCSRTANFIIWGAGPVRATPDSSAPSCCRHPPYSSALPRYYLALNMDPVSRRRECDLSQPSASLGLPQLDLGSSMRTQSGRRPNLWPIAPKI